MVENARVKSMFPQAIHCVFGNVGKGVVGPVQDGVLAEHGSHLCDFEDGEEGSGAQVRSEKYGGCEWDENAVCDDGSDVWVVGLRLQAVE